jgi:hypothetical protein
MEEAREGCLGCQLIEASAVRLDDGRVVCSSCEDWREECEARMLLGKPLQFRRDYLKDLENNGRHGMERANSLRRVMSEIHARVKNGRHQQK